GRFGGRISEGSAETGGGYTPCVESEVAVSLVDAGDPGRRNLLESLQRPTRPPRAPDLREPLGIFRLDDCDDLRVIRAVDLTEAAVGEQFIVAPGRKMEYSTNVPVGLARLVPMREAGQPQHLSGWARDQREGVLGLV